MVGMFMIGPAELFFPNAAFNLHGVSVWAIILLLYVSLLIFFILNSRPRIVAYGFRDHELVSFLYTALEKLDPSARWLDKHFIAPGLQIEGVVEQAGFGQIAHAVTTTRDQNVGLGSA